MIRRQLSHSGEMPALSYFFGLRWEHIDEMPLYELQAYRGWLNDLTERR